ncbi:hypothetical protein V8G54_027111 [Vigna mungo]|uniref:F-box domain-containing protein n=1 Tax=Vigna mungo TaxID=3915 RepID=A0AAQ3N1X0_VIGMU
MADRMSGLSDEFLLYILSFAPTKQVVAISVVSERWKVLSKRWTLLWRSVSSLDFDANKEDFYKNDYDKRRYYRSACSFLVGRGDQPLYRFRLRCHHHMNFAFRDQSLTILKLEDIRVDHISFVDLPFLKILHLERIIFPIEDDPSQVLFGCPNLEDLNVRALISQVKGKFIRFPKLVRANIDNHLLSLETFKEVEVLRLDWVTPLFELQLSVLLYVNFDFHNLVQL